MDRDKEVPTVTSEIPVSLDRLALIHRITLRYMRVKGLFLAMIGCTWVVFQSPSRLAGIEWIYGLDGTMVGALWIFGGLSAVVTSYFRNQNLRQWGWFMLIFVPALVGAYFFISWILYLVPVASITGYGRGGITTISYWAFSASAYLMSRVSALSEGASHDKGAV